MSSGTTICQKCGKSGYAPYQMSVAKALAGTIIGGRSCIQVYWYDVYRHLRPERRKEDAEKAHGEDS